MLIHRAGMELGGHLAGSMCADWTVMIICLLLISMLRIPTDAPYQRECIRGCQATLLTNLPCVWPATGVEGLLKKQARTKMEGKKGFVWPGCQHRSSARNAKGQRQRVESSCDVHRMAGQPARQPPSQPRLA